MAEMFWAEVLLVELLLVMVQVSAMTEFYMISSAGMVLRFLNYGSLRQYYHHWHHNVFVFSLYVFVYHSLRKKQH